MYFLDSGKDENKSFEDLESRLIWLDRWLFSSNNSSSPALRMRTFHAVTDWYNAYISSGVTELLYQPDVIFVDGNSCSNAYDFCICGIILDKVKIGSICGTMVGMNKQDLAVTTWSSLKHRISASVQVERTFALFV
ncbi:hypothetical protein ACJRO7_023067 [Eucalyptus globulus]|uniref:Uncharacterized protein n=1 Tax=Eucalyptus globulus TaxID=34317 RepID=A0ABD3K0V4_EUCGL